MCRSRDEASGVDSHHDHRRLNERTDGGALKSDESSDSAGACASSLKYPTT